MLVIGLTGSIGTGKSEVARLLESLGAEKSKKWDSQFKNMNDATIHPN